MRLYIAGPMTGLPDFNYPAFKAAADKLREAGYEVECPAEHDLPADTTWHGYVKHGITRMLRCDAVATLAGVEKSKGGRLETDIARRVGMPVKMVVEWLR